MVLALKYRPKRFEEIVGQDAIVKTLINSLDNNRIANAYLFSGLRGSGKTTTARVFAKSLLCDSGPTSTPCDKCQNCLMANENRHIDIIEIDAASNRKIENIRDLIEQTKYKPAVGRYKIFIIDEVHMLTNEAFNALLKTLEEPPEFVKFIMATTDPLKLPATILSRVQHFRFNKIKNTILINHLKKIVSNENISFEDEAIRMIAVTAKGSLRDALTLTDQAIAFSKGDIKVDLVAEMLNVVNPEFISQLFSFIKSRDKESVIELVETLKEFDIESIFEEIIVYLKNSMLQEEFSLITIQRFFNIIADSKELIKSGVDNEFILNLTFFRMIEATKTNLIDELIQNLEQDIKIDNSSLSIKQDVKSDEEKFKELILEIKNRDIDVGICFETAVKFIELKNNILVWESCPDIECKRLLAKNFATLIKPIITEIFGEVDIEPKRCKKEIKTSIPQTSTSSENKETKFIQKVREVFGSDVKIFKIKKEN